MYVYINNDTYAYKYNYTNMILKESTIHNEHINFQYQIDKFQQYEIFKNLALEKNISS